MTLAEFKQLVDLLKKADTQVDKAYEANVDLIEFADVYHAIIAFLILDIYGEDGADWFSWWAYENKFGEGDLTATDENGNEILKTIEEVWMLLENKRKIKNNLNLKIL